MPLELVIQMKMKKGTQELLNKIVNHDEA